MIVVVPRTMNGTGKTMAPIVPPEGDAQDDANASSLRPVSLAVLLLSASMSAGTREVAT